MIHDIKPHKYDNQYRAIKPDANSVVLCYRERTVLVEKKEERIELPRISDISESKREQSDRYTYLFTIDDDRYYLGNAKNFEGNDRFTWENVGIFRSAEPQHLAFAEITGYQLFNWYNNHQFCGKCGKPMSHDSKERMMYCEACKIMEYPKLSPAVIVGVINGDKILMSKYAGREYSNYALLAGFAEIGESIEDTVRREVMEEVGLKLKNLTYYKSQPWPLSESLLFGFFAELDGEDSITLDEEELAMADWFSREAFPIKADGISLTNEMMMAFKNGFKC
ncbi:NAD(+) diphosphatase [Lachnospiraceae bacterium OttesenSCG-928-E19]|nr:NAD(+) diphosphatase [Lachnospiraceae bacterium OttesenSCG-928-E19]